jgi:hypothetical protein
MVSPGFSRGGRMGFWFSGFIITRFKVSGFRGFFKLVLFVSLVELV